MTSGGTPRFTVSWPLLAAATLAALTLIASGAAAERAAASCANAEAAIGDASGKELGKALACLINNKRSKRDRKKLDSNGKLQEAAKRHNETMLDQNCWAHKCNGEDGLEKRIRKTGYLKGASRWRFAQNFGCALTPKGMLNAWVANDFTRRNLLNPAYEDLGVAAAKDLVANPPSGCEGDRVTYTVVLASRK